MSAPATWTKLWERSWAATDARRGTSYCIGYSAPAGTTMAAATSAFPFYSVYPGESGLFAPLVSRHHVASDADHGRDLVRVWWDPPTIRQALERNQGRGILQIDISGVERQAVTQYGKMGGTGASDMAYVWHDESKLVGGAYIMRRWRPIQGPGTVLDARCMLRLRTAARHTWINTVMGLIGTVNGSALAQFGNAGAETLRMAGAHTERAMTTDALSWFDILVEYNPNGWNNETWVQRYLYKVRKVQVTNDAGAGVTNRYRDVGGWEAVLPAYKAKLYKSASWAFLTRDVGW